jgi:dolichyl-diphosphooligosaccharide--protein glycosyltransferase/undecaprenyl-diphosphooligosaccharide--protein glycosyltransferase
MKELLSLKEDKLNWKIVLFLILIAYGFNIAVRYIYISYVGDIPQFQWQGHLMINNNDGYYWAEGARDILAGHHEVNDLSPVTNPASILTAYIAKFLPFIPFDVLIEYLPGFLGSLVVVPVVLIGRVLGSTWLGFLAGLMSGMVWSYYHRTMFGYYDTDMLVIVLPTFAVWAVLWSITNKNIKFFFLAPLIEILMIKWHIGLLNVANGIFIMSALYLGAIFYKERKFSNEWLLVFLLIVPLLPVAFLFKIVILFLLYGVMILKKELIQDNLKYVLIGGAVLYLAVVGMPWVMKVLNSGYFTRAVTSSEDGFKYIGVVNTVSEASPISFNTLVHRVSGSLVGFILGFMGYILLLIRYPKMIISLPMVVLGLFALKGGLRFTVFAVPFFALGDAYIAYLTTKIIFKMADEKIKKYLIYGGSLILMVGFIYPNYKHIHRYIMPTVFNDYEVRVLDKLKTIAKRDDYVLTWWDYGYPIRYYADVKTLVDGGKHSGVVNFPVSFALTRDLLSSRNMAVLDVYFTEYDYNHNIKNTDYLKQMMKKYDFKDPEDFMDYLSTPIKLPKIKEDIYYFLPFRMFDILPTVAVFSTIDLKTGKKKGHFFIQSNGFKQQQNILLLNAEIKKKRIKLDLAKRAVVLGKQLIPIKIFAITQYDKKGKLHKLIQKVSNQGINIIIMKSYGKILLMDDFYFNSAYIQLFVFENRGGLFEPVILDPSVKVYKVKK